MVRLAIGLIRVYQKFISPFTPGVCRFYPTCSEYAVQSLVRYGFFRGSYRSLKRIARCHPFNPGGYDPV